MSNSNEKIMNATAGTQMIIHHVCPVFPSSEALEKEKAQIAGALFSVFRKYESK